MKDTNTLIKLALAGIADVNTLMEKLDPVVKKDIINEVGQLVVVFEDILDTLDYYK